MANIKKEEQPIKYLREQVKTRKINKLPRNSKYTCPKCFKNDFNNRTITEHIRNCKGH